MNTLRTDAVSRCRRFSRSFRTWPHRYTRLCSLPATAASSARCRVRAAALSSRSSLHQSSTSRRGHVSSYWECTPSHSDNLAFPHPNATAERRQREAEEAAAAAVAINAPSMPAAATQSPTAMDTSPSAALSALLNSGGPASGAGKRKTREQQEAQELAAESACPPEDKTLARVTHLRLFRVRQACACSRGCADFLSPLLAVLDPHSPQPGA